MTKLTGVLITLLRLAASINVMARTKSRRKTTSRQKSSSIEVQAWQQRCYELIRDNERLTIEAQDARQQLCQLRIDGGAYGEGVHRRIGYMVGTFIPEGVLDKLRKNPDLVPEFQKHIVDVMVTSAIRAMLFVNEKGKQVAMVFVPYNNGDIRKRANLPVFESAQGFKMIVPEKLQDEIDKMLKEQAEDERRKLLRY